MCGRVSGDAHHSLDSEHYPWDGQCPCPGKSANVYGPLEKILDLQLDLVKRSVPPPTRSDEADMEVKMLDPGKLQKGAQDFRKKDLKEHRAWTSYAISWRNE